MAESTGSLWNGRGAAGVADNAFAEIADIGSKIGIFPAQRIRNLINRRMIKSRSGSDIQFSQIQPASLDLRLGKRAYRVRASFLPGSQQTVREQLEQMQLHEFSLENGAVLEKECVYVVELEEFLKLPPSVSAVANPKSSTGRLDVFTRLITDKCEVFDYVKPGYEGNLYAEVSPRTFGIKVYTGSRLNQLRFRRRAGAHEEFHRPKLSDGKLRKLHSETPLVDGEPIFRDGLVIRVDLKGSRPSSVIGYRAQKHTGIIDVNRSKAYKVSDFWESIRANTKGRLILDPTEFYILASKEALHIPPGYAAEMMPIDPMMGEFRAHYAGFFDPGFGYSAVGDGASRAVLEVRSHDVPFFLEDGQAIARLVYEALTEDPDRFYGGDIGSNYQSQGLKLSKHFKQRDSSNRTSAPQSAKKNDARRQPSNDTNKSKAKKKSAELNLRTNRAARRSKSAPTTRPRG